LYHCSWICTMGTPRPSMMWSSYKLPRTSTTHTLMRNSTFSCTGRGIYPLRIPLVLRIFIVAAVRCKIKKPLAQPAVPSAYEHSGCSTTRAMTFLGRPYTLRRDVVRIVRHSPQRPGSCCKLCGEITAVGGATFLPLPLTTY
jgi:hypothetical protein